MTGRAENHLIPERNTQVRGCISEITVCTWENIMVSIEHLKKVVDGKHHYSVIHANRTATTYSDRLTQVIQFQKRHSKSGKKNISWDSFLQWQWCSLLRNRRRMEKNIQIFFFVLLNAETRLTQQQQGQNQLVLYQFHWRSIIFMYL